MSGVSNYRHANASRSSSQSHLPAWRRPTYASPLSSGPSLGDSTRRRSPVCPALSPILEQAHLSPPLYLRDAAKSKCSGAGLPGSSTAPINHNCELGQVSLTALSVCSLCVRQGYKCTSSKACWEGYTHMQRALVRLPASGSALRM